MLQKKCSKEELMTLSNAKSPYPEKRETMTGVVDGDGQKLTCWYTTLPQPMDMNLLDV